MLYSEYPAQDATLKKYASVYFRYTTKAFVDQREIYGLFAFLSDVGGFIQIFTILGYFLLGDS